MWITFWMILYDENCMKLKSYIWDNIWTHVCLCIKYWCICGNRYLLHWWSKSQTKISGGEKLMGEFMHIVTYEIHGLGCIELTLILSLGFAGNLSLGYRIRCRTGLSEGVDCYFVCWISWMCRFMWDLCDCCWRSHID